MSGKKSKNRKRKNIFSPEFHSTPKKPNFNVSMESQIKFLVECNKQMVEDNKKIVENTNSIKDELNQLHGWCKNQFSQTNLQVLSIEKRVAEIEQQNCKKSINVFGIPILEEENTSTLIKVIKKLFGTIKVAVQENHIDNIHRFGKSKKNIRVDLVTTLKKKEILEASKGKIFCCKDAGLQTEGDVYVLEYLSHKNHQILIEAKQLRKKGIVSYVWIANGVVLVRKKEGDNAMALKTFEDLEKLKSDNRIRLG